MTDPTYSIRNWSENFENNRTRDLKEMKWIPVPNKHDGDGYTELLDHQNGAAHLGAWLAILQVASKCEVRGTLLRQGAGPHNARTISRITRIPVDIVAEALFRLSSVEIGWMDVSEVSQIEGDATIPQEGAGSTAQSRSGVRESDYGKEGKGKEGNKDICASGGCTDIDSPSKNPKPKKKAKPAAQLERYEDWAGFVEWWGLYPNAKDKRSAFESWQAAGCEGEAPLIIDALRDYISQYTATKARGEFVPPHKLGATYINNRCFEDYDPNAATSRVDPTEGLNMYAPLPPERRNPQAPQMCNGIGLQNESKGGAL